MIKKSKHKTSFSLYILPVTIYAYTYQNIMEFLQETQSIYIYSELFQFSAIFHGIFTTALYGVYIQALYEWYILSVSLKQ